MNSSPRMRFALAWLPAALYMLLIWWLSSRALNISTDSFPFRDKGAHVVEYGVLGMLVAHALAGTYPSRSRAALWWWATGLTVLFGMTDEIHQAFVPGRSSDILDVAADAVGAVAGASVRLWLIRPNGVTQHKEKLG